MHPSRTRALLPALLSVIALVVAGLAFPAPAAAADADVKINEFSSNSPDFVELINTGSSAVDLSGWVLKDNTENNSLTFPAGTTIAAGAILGLSGENVEFNFGLGNGDSVRLYAPGAVEIDSYTYPGHPPAGKSYGRCPDGTGSFVITQAATKGAPNACATPNTAVKINEFSSNSPDFIELINTGSGPVDISGWVLKDNSESNSYTFPAGTSLAAGEIRGISGETVEFVFGLGNGDSVRLFTPASTTLIDSHTYPGHPPAGKSYGRCPNGAGDFVITEAATKGAANSCPAPPTTVKINELSSNSPDFIELINTGSSAVSLAGWVLKDSTDGNPYTFPAGSTIAAGAILGLSGESVDFAFGLGNGDAVRLFAPGGTVLIDSHTYAAHPPAGKSHGRCPDGTGAFVITEAATKGTANACTPAGPPSVVINEVESNGDQVADWVELKNTGTTPVAVSGWKIVDGDPSHAATPVVVPANTVIPAGGYYAIYTEIAQSPGFGLGVGDSVNLFLADGTTQVDTTTWGAHAATTWGRCPDGTGTFRETTTSTRGLANACSPVRINEIESDLGAPGDWIELKNISGSPVDVSGWSVKDSSDSSNYTLPSGSTIAPNGYLVLDVADFVFGLGSADAVRLYDASAVLVESYTWTAHATQTFGRCKDGVGSFADTKAPTKGSTNSCPGLETQPWPGSQSVATADLAATHLQDLSGLAFDPSEPDVLWASQNKKGTLFKLVRDGSNWVPAPGWPKDPTFLGGTGAPDTEGLTIGPDGFVYLASERDNNASGVSRMSVLRYDPASTGATIQPTAEWNLTSKIPAAGANLGLEGVTWVPDSYLVGNGFTDQSTTEAYDPADYPAHGTGLYFVAVENTGDLHAFALDSDGSTSHLIATIDSGFPQLADVTFDRERGRVWAVTDDTHDGKTSLLKIESGAFVVDVAYDRPVEMPNINNEGLAIAPQSRCVDGRKEVLWSDDGDTGGFSIRRGAINCTPPAPQIVTITSTPPSPAVVGATYEVTATGGGSGNPVVLSIDLLSQGVCSVVWNTVSFDHPGECVIRAGQAAAPGFLAGGTTQSVTVTKAPQTISFTQPANTVFGGASVPLVASADSGLPVSFTSQTPGVCVIDGSSARPVGAGACTISASQAGNGDVAAAAPVSRTLTVAKAGIVVTTRSTSGLVSLLTLRVYYSTTVISAVTGLPVAGVPVTTRVNGGSPTGGCSAITNASGVAACTAGPISIALGVRYTASAAETANHQAGAGTAFIGLL